MLVIVKGTKLPECCELAPPSFFPKRDLLLRTFGVSACSTLEKEDTRTTCLSHRVGEGGCCVSVSACLMATESLAL